VEQAGVHHHHSKPEEAQRMVGAYRRAERDRSHTP
jgi:hypothetical protein